MCNYEKQHQFNKHNQINANYSLDSVKYLAIRFGHCKILLMDIFNIFNYAIDEYFTQWS